MQVATACDAAGHIPGSYPAHKPGEQPVHVCTAMYPAVRALAPSPHTHLQEVWPGGSEGAAVGEGELEVPGVALGVEVGGEDGVGEGEEEGVGEGLGDGLGGAVAVMLKFMAVWAAHRPREPEPSSQWSTRQQSISAPSPWKSPGLHQPAGLPLSWSGVAAPTEPLDRSLTTPSRGTVPPPARGKGDSESRSIGNIRLPSCAA